MRKHMALSLKICTLLFLGMMTLLPTSCSKGTKAEQPQSAVLQENDSALGEGKYVLLGKYLNKPILWKVIAISEDGRAILFSEHILTFKAFDAAESGDATPGRGFSRATLGSNRWANSNLREWLNSSEKKVAYSTQAPVKAAISDGANAYADEPGFLCGFSENERKLLLDVTYKVSLSKEDQGEAEGGADALVWRGGTPLKAASNESSVAYEEVTDKVFLLSIQEAGELLEAKGMEWRRSACAEAKKQAGTDNMLAGDTYGYYLLRTPHGEDGTHISFVYDNGTVGYFPSFTGKLGVVPAVAVSLDCCISSGKGSIEKPFVLE